jgi:hypothetical protein
MQNEVLMRDHHHLEIMMVHLQAIIADRLLQEITAVHHHQVIIVAHHQEIIEGLLLQSIN